jgi:sirohydrochlorin cobaltochelatase
MNISVSRALISSKEDFRKITDIFKKRLTDKNRLYVFMGHGSSHMANSLYTSLADKFFDAGMDNVYIATLNAKPSIDDILRISRASGKKDVTLMPFMLLSGKHTRSDMALKWKALFEENGFNVTCSMTSLGEIKEIQEIFCEHLGEIFENTDGCMA